MHYDPPKGDARGPAYVNCPETRANIYVEGALDRRVGAAVRHLEGTLLVDPCAKLI